MKNPEFSKEVSSLCKEDDRLVVVISNLLFLFFSINDVGVGSRAKYFFSLQGCQSGVRSLYATADLLTIVSLFNFNF